MEHRLVLRCMQLAAVLFVGLFTSTVNADAMRCGNRLIRFGDTASAVKAICGEPSDVQTHTIVRRPTYDLNGRTYYYGEGYVELPVEVWTSNFGPYKLIRRVRFIDGLVDEIETLGYGFREK
jgi:Protein of unknown function (DUF2845)